MIFSLSLASALAAEKPTCAVLNFDAKAGITKDEAEILTERFAGEFGKLGKFQLISRSKMKDVLDLQKFARSDQCSATECAIEVGRLLNAQWMVYGSIGKVGGTWTVNAALVSVESGAISNQASVGVKGQVDDLWTSGMQNAARELAGLPGLGGGSVGEAPPVSPAASSSGGPVKNQAYLSIRVTPSQATLTLNGNRIQPGRVPVAANEPLELVGKADGYAPYSQTFRISAGATQDVDVRLTPRYVSPSPPTPPAEITTPAAPPPKRPKVP